MSRRPRNRLQAAYAITLDPNAPRDPRGLPRIFRWSGWKRRQWPAEVIRPGLLLYGFDKRTRRLAVLLKVLRGGTFTYRSLGEFSRRVRALTRLSPSTDDPYWPTLPAATRARPRTGGVVRCRAGKRVDIPRHGRLHKLRW